MEPYIDIEHASAGSAACELEVSTRIACDVDRDSDAETINALIYSACEHLPITGEQLYAELEQGGDLSDIHSGTLAPTALRLTAETLALMRYATSSGKVIESDKSRDLREVA